VKVYKDIDKFIAVNNAVVTTGTFDGLHIGHRAIISRVKQLATELQGESLIITFYPHPQLVLKPDDKNILILNSEEEKIALFEQLNIDHLIFIPFTPEFATVPYTDFIKNILIDKLNVRKLVIGYDHHFGNNRKGDFQHLLEYGKKYNFEVEQVAEQKAGESEVSSTKIRKALFTGDIKTANNLLGYEYFFSGHVVKGDGVGRTLGYPTANLEITNPNKLIPAEGVYAVNVDFEKKQYGGMLSIGTRPTFDGIRLVIEVNIFDFDKNIYYELLTVRMIEKLRDEVKFSDIEALKEQLLRDKENAQRILIANSR
jgi:riboflavin kinase / FMN adenylyltransferase